MNRKRKIPEEEKAKVIGPITTKNLRSIEELAKIGMPFQFLSKEQQRWLAFGGLEYFKKHKPYLYPVIKDMMERKAENPIPLSFEELSQMVAEKINEKVYPAYVEKIVRWKLDPFYTESEKMIKIAKMLKEVLDELSKKEGEEKFRWLKKSVEEWLKWNKKARELKSY
ncbi:hypothetical protein [Aquifex sp.]